MLTFTVTKRLPTMGQNPFWELTCGTCGATRQAYGSAISAALNGRCQLRPCGCVTGRYLSTHRCVDVYGMGVGQVEVLLMVMAIQRTGNGEAVSRLDLEKRLGRDPNTIFLVRKGYLERIGNPQRLSATAKTWREFGFSPTGWPGDAIDPKQIPAEAQYR